MDERQRTIHYTEQRMYEKLSSINDTIQRICETGGALMLVALVLLTSLQIVARIVGVSLPWPGQVAQFLLVGFTYMALPVLFRTGEDISFRPILNGLSYSKKRVLYLISNTVLILFFGFIVVSATQAAEARMMVGLSTVRWLKIGYMYLFMGLMMFVAILPVVEEMIEIWNHVDDSTETLTDSTKTASSD